MPQKLSGYAVLGCSPPFGVFQLDGDVNIYRSCIDNAPGTPTRYTDWADGGLTTDQVVNAVLSPNQAKIVYEQWNSSTGYAEVWVVDNVPNSTPTVVVSDANEYCRHPQWAPDNDTVVYTRSINSTNVGGQVESISVTGGGPTVLYTPADTVNYGCWRPSVNFDGSGIAFWLLRTIGNDATEGLYSMDSNGTNVVQLTSGQNYRTDGSQHGWARTQDVVCFMDGVTDVYKINRDGTGLTQLNSVGPIAGAATHVSWSCWAPNDEFIVVAGFTGPWMPFRLETDGSGSTLLNALHGAYNQNYMKNMIIYDSRVWFIEGASNGNLGQLSSIAMDGTDYVNNLDLSLGSVGDYFYGGSGFEFE